MDKEDLKNVILVASKPLSSYILVANKVKDKYENMILKARGKNINVLVNLAEIMKREGMKEESIKIGTESFKTEEGKEILVSSMEVTLVR